MKKVTVFILTFILFIPIVNGKNINDLYGELNALESQKNLYSYLNSEDIKSLSNNGLDIQIIIDSLNDEINELDKVALNQSYQKELTGMTKGLTIDSTKEEKNVGVAGTSDSDIDSTNSEAQNGGMPVPEDDNPVQIPCIWIGYTFVEKFAKVKYIDL